MNKKKKKKKQKLLMGVTIGGPAPGAQFQVDPNARFHKVLLTNNPHYSVAVYAYTKQFTVTGEMAAVFLRCIKREEDKCTAMK